MDSMDCTTQSIYGSAVCAIIHGLHCSWITQNEVHISVIRTMINGEILIYIVVRMCNKVL